MSMFDIFLFNSAGALLSMKWNPGLILRIFNSLIDAVKACIIYLSLLFLISVVRMELQYYLVYIQYVDLFISLFMWWGSFRIDKSKFYLVQKETFVLGFSYRSISGNFHLVGCSPHLLMCRFPIVVLIDFSVCLFINCSVRTDQVLSKYSLIASMKACCCQDEKCIRYILWKFWFGCLG